MIVHIGQYSVEEKRIEQEPQGKANGNDRGYACLHGHLVWLNHQRHIVLYLPLSWFSKFSGG